MRVLKRSAVVAASWFEILAGAVFILAPSYLCRLLFAATPEDMSRALAHFAGIGLTGLGISCLPSTAAEPRRSAVLGLFAFNVGVAILFAGIGATPSLRGSLLWPAAILHAVLAAALVPQLMTKSSLSS
jgi:hypothetical protein